MRNQWVGESADFGKYALLNALCQPEPRDEDEYSALCLGVVWYWRPDVPDVPPREDDGREPPATFNYLKSEHQEHFRPCDPDLYDKLKRIVESKHPQTADVEAGGILPKDTAYYRKSVPDGTGKQAEKEEAREEWARGALKKVAGCGLVFVDTDTGICIPSNPFSPKHTRIEELKQFAERGQERERSLVVYQHQSRGTYGNIVSRAYEEQDQIKGNIGPSFAMVCCGGGSPPTTFHIVPADGQRECLLSRARFMLRGKWAQHFIMVGEQRFLEWTTGRTG